MNIQEGSSRILKVGIATGITGVIAMLMAIVFKDDLRQVVGYLFLLGCGMCVFGAIFSVIGYIAQGFAKQ